MAHDTAAALLPLKPKKESKPIRKGVVFIAHHDGKAVLERRPAKGLLGGMMGFPTTGWSSAKDAKQKSPLSAETPPFAANWHVRNESVRHIFTHFELHLTLYEAYLPQADLASLNVPETYQLLDPLEAGLASVFAKVWQVISD